AGYAADWLWRSRRPAPVGALAALVMGTIAAGGAYLGLARASEELVLRGSVLRAVHDYAAAPGIPPNVDGLPLTPPRVAQLAAAAFTPANDATAWQLGLLAATFVLLIAWLLAGYTRWAAAPVRTLLVGATIAFVAADLLIAGRASHPLDPV